MNETVHQRNARVTYDMFLDCHRDATAAACQLGTTARTVRARVRRHVLRIVLPVSDADRKDQP